MSGQDESLWVLISCALRMLRDDLDPEHVRHALGDDAAAAFSAGGLTQLEAQVFDQLERDGYLITSPIVTGVVQLARQWTEPDAKPSTGPVLDLSDAAMRDGSIPR